MDGEEADVPTAGAGCGLRRGLHGRAGYLMHPAAPRLPRETQPTHHPPPSLCPPLPRGYSVAISQEPLIPPSPLYRSPPSSPLFSILIILITLFASLSRRSNPSVCAQADTQTFISSPPSARLAFFAPAFGGGKEKLAFLPWPVGQALPLSLALQGHFILPRRMGLIYLSPPLYPFQMRDLKNNKYKAQVGANACALPWSFPSPGRQRCPDELGAVPGEHCWVARSKVSLEKSFFLLNLDAKMLLGGGGGGQRQGCQT